MIDLTVSGPSPMMQAHAAVRAAAPGHLVLYRVGEFYEVLGDDARRDGQQETSARGGTR